MYIYILFWSEKVIGTCSQNGASYQNATILKKPQTGITVLSGGGAAAAAASGAIMTHDTWATF